MELQIIIIITLIIVIMLLVRINAVKLYWDLYGKIQNSDVFKKTMWINEKDEFKDANPDEKGAIDRWSVRHAVGSMLIGIFLPGKWLIFFIGSIIFEVTEWWIAKSGGSDHVRRKEPLSNQFADIIFNMAGYYVGSLLVINYDFILVLSGVLVVASLSYVVNLIYSLTKMSQ